MLKRAPEEFDTAGLVMTRHEAVSSDGTRIPYMQVAPANETGNAPVHLYGHGDFGISMVPFYHPAVGKLWLERGGTSVIATFAADASSAMLGMKRRAARGGASPMMISPPLPPISSAAV